MKKFLVVMLLGATAAISLAPPCYFNFGGCMFGPGTGLVSHWYIANNAACDPVDNKCKDLSTGAWVLGTLVSPA
ncbi:MAG: hypothetical protein IT203_03430 [Fimbriimonadaceae bacterium]|nr:hypothetical protein [Fimbriimonadaceae bacterium]